MVTTTIFATLVSKVADDLDRNDLNTQIQQAINEAVYYYSAYSFRFNNTVEVFQTINDVSQYTSANGLPDNIMHIKAAQLYSDEIYNYTLEPIEYTEMLNLTSDVDTVAGMPSYWSWYNETFYIYPTPNQVLNISLSYKKTYPRMTQANDNNDFTNNAPDLIRARAEQQLCATILKDMDGYQVYKTVADDLLKSYKKRFANSQPPIDITPRMF